MKAAGLVKTGKTYALGIPVDSQNTRLPAAHLQDHYRAARTGRHHRLGPSKTTYNDDIIEGWVGIGSQIDGLGHIGVDARLLQWQQARRLRRSRPA